MTQTDHVDLIDISALFGDDPSAQDACDKALWEGLRRTGAVCLAGYPDADEIDRRASLGLAFFELPDAARNRIASRHRVPGNPTLYRGYHPHDPASTFRTDFLDIGPEDPAPGPDLPGVDLVTERTPWPDVEPAPGWRDAVRAYYLQLDRVGKAVMLSLGRSAGFAPEVIGARFEGEHSTLRFLDYPASGAAPDNPERFSAGCHTDASGLSLLWQGGPGLQAQGPDGAFRDVPVNRNSLSLHVGTVMTTLTDGAVPATPHRVRDLGERRQSVGFFLEPALGAAVTPARRADDEVRIEDTYAWQLLTQLSGYGEYGKCFPRPGAAKDAVTA